MCSPQASMSAPVHPVGFPIPTSHFARVPSGGAFSPNGSPASGTGQARGEPVTLHVYHLGSSQAAQTLNNLARNFGTGAYHAGIEVYGQEWSFGDSGDDDPVTSGVFCCAPRSAGDGDYVYKEAIPMGNTRITRKEFLWLVEDMSREWRVEQYCLLRRNCCHFSDELCRRLGVNPLPKWVSLHLAGTGAALGVDHKAAALADRAQQVGAGVAAKAPSLALTGRLSRGGSEEESYEFGDVTRGLMSKINSTASGIIDQGKATRGADSSTGYKFGDFSRGIVRKLTNTAPS
mmetsp:Transcript_69219/g.165985  ORF Transcript_69219/g.165985 Transcript_69219/m.165985 type:complete len:289 (+) Transcript_69219:85-951(+)